jgi:acyl-CoA thioester hydrolase
MPEFVATYRVHVYEVDAWGELSTAGTIRYLQQTASDASAAIGFPLDWYDRMGTVWLIRRTTLERFAPATYDDRLTVRTWVTDMRRVRSERAYEITRTTDGAVLARATTDWVYVDVARGLPARVPRALQEALMPDGIVMATRRPDPWPTPPAHAHQTRRRVEIAHLDSVAHVNNAKYADYLEQDVFDGLAAHGWTVDPAARDDRLRLRTLDIEYLSPAHYDREVEAHTWATSVTEGGFACAHRLRADGRDLVCARTSWEWSGSAPAAAARAWC